MLLPALLYIIRPMYGICGRCWERGLKWIVEKIVKNKNGY